MSNRILSYKGLLASGTQDTILLSTKKGEIGYMIRSFRAMGGDPLNNEDEAVLKIYSDVQSASTDTVDFSDTTLLAAAVWTSRATARSYPLNEVVIFDNKIINQDIYVTCLEGASGNAVNYYLELEVIKLDESQAMVATLKDIRNNS